jgi:hypothetical protein
MINHFFKTEGDDDADAENGSLLDPRRRFLFSNQTQTASVRADKESRTALNVNKLISVIPTFMIAMLKPQMTATSNKLMSARREWVFLMAGEDVIACLEEI